MLLISGKQVNHRPHFSGGKKLSLSRETIFIVSVSGAFEGTCYLKPNDTCKTAINMNLAFTYMDFCMSRSGIRSDTEAYFRRLIHTKSCYRSEILLPKGVDKFLTYELKTLSNETSEKSVLFYLIFSDKCSTWKTSHSPGFSNLIGFNHSGRDKCNKPCCIDKCLIAKLSFHCYCDVPGLEAGSIPAMPSAVQLPVHLHQGLCPFWCFSGS